MNCKQGDIAITFGAPMDNGILVEVVGKSLWQPPGGEYCWLIRSLGSPFHMTPTTRSQECVWPDVMLRPIRDPGDDAEDEMLRPLPEGVTA